MDPQSKYIKSISVSNFRFINDFRLDFMKPDGSVNQWTVLLGNNNTGKTSILKLIEGLNPIGEDKLYAGGKKEYVFPEGFNKRFDENFEVLSDIQNYEGWGDEIKEQHYWMYNDCSFSSIAKTFMNDFCIYGYGTYRNPSQSEFNESITDGVSSLYPNTPKLLNIDQWILKLFIGSNNNNERVKNLYNIFNSLICKENLFPDIIDFKINTDDNLNNTVLYKTIYGWCKFEDLASGYQSMLSWFVDLCYRMFIRYPESKNPLTEPAIVLLDEIDLNLHPQWQREIVSFLTRTFPNVQFIATTHSPFVVQSMESVNLYVLNREGEKVNVSRVSGNDFRGWSVEEILKDVMDMKKNVRTDWYNELMAKFFNSILCNDADSAKSAYSEMKSKLPPNSDTLSIMEIQLSQMV